MKILGKIVILLLGTIFCMVLTFSIISTLIIQDIGNEQAQKQLDVAAKSMKHDIENIFFAHEGLHTVFTQSQQLIDAVATNNTTAMHTITKQIIQATSIDFITICDLDGTVLARGHSDKKGDMLYKNMVSFTTPLTKGTAIIGLERNTESPIAINSGVPVIKDGKTIAVMIVGQDITSGDFVTAYKENHGVEATVFADDIRASTTILRNGKPVVGTALNNPAIYDKVIKKNETVSSSNVISGKNYTTIYWPWQDISGKNAGIFFVGISMEQIATTQQKILLYFVGASLILAAIIGIVGYIVTKKLVLPLQQTREYAQAVRQGDFSGDINSTSKDEIGSVIRALRNMVQQIKERLGFAQGIMQGITSPFMVVDTNNKITFLNKKLVDYWGHTGSIESYIGKTSGEFLHSDIHRDTPLTMVLESYEVIENLEVIQVNAAGHKKYIHVAAVPLVDMDKHIIGACMLLTDETERRDFHTQTMILTQNINRSVMNANNIYKEQHESFCQLQSQLEETSEAAVAQTAAAQETLRSITQMRDTLDVLAAKVMETSKSTKATQREAKDGHKVVIKTVEQITHVAKYAERTAQGISVLGERASGITHIVELIKDIADQTNLLALNAAIEAARAGDAGRGFAVVADEVRKLAEKTMLATNEVNDSISALQDEVEQTIALTQETVQLTHASTQLAEQSGEKLKYIVDIAEHSVSEVSAIAHATAEESQTCALVASSVHEISAMATQAVENMTASHACLDNLSIFSDQLKQLIATMGKDRRSETRINIDTGYAITIRGLAAAPLVCNLVDISRHGIRFSTHEEVEIADTIGKIITLSGANGQFAIFLNGAKGKILDVDKNFYGVYFEKPLFDDSIRLNKFMGELRYNWVANE